MGSAKQAQKEEVRLAGPQVSLGDSCLQEERSDDLAICRDPDRPFQILGLLLTCYVTRTKLL